MCIDGQGGKTRRFYARINNNRRWEDRENYTLKDFGLISAAIRLKRLNK